VLDICLFSDKAFEISILPLATLKFIVNQYMLFFLVKNSFVTLLHDQQRDVLADTCCYPDRVLVHSSLLPSRHISFWASRLIC